MCKDQGNDDDKRENKNTEATSEEVKREHGRGFEQMLGASMELIVNDDDVDDDAFRPLLILISGLTTPSFTPLSLSSLR